MEINDLKDIKEKVEEVVEKIKNDDKLLEQFKKEPIKTVEELAGVDLPDDKLEKVVELVKQRVDAGKGGLGEKLKGLFGKK